MLPAGAFQLLGIGSERSKYCHGPGHADSVQGFDRTSCRIGDRGGERRVYLNRGLSTRSARRPVMLGCCSGP
jgi:hypothetical protein